jgi:hypothetical protein
MENSVPGQFKDVFAWVMKTTIVEYRLDNRSGFISLLRGLEPGTKWWWSDDAIPDAAATDASWIFESRNQEGKEGSVTKDPYPDILDVGGVEAGVALAERLHLDLTPAEPSAPASHRRSYLEMIAPLLNTRTKYAAGFFHLPWLVVGYHLASRFLMIAEFGVDTPWYPDDVDQVDAALYGFGLHCKYEDVPTIVDQLLAVDWSHDLAQSEGRAARLHGFVNVAMAFHDMALTAYSKTRFVVPLYESFISYAAADHEFANDLARKIEQTQTAEVWFDGRAVSMGLQLTETLKSAIAASERLVLIASAASADSDFVHLEAEFAASRGIPIVVLPVGEHLHTRWASDIETWHAQGLKVDVLSPNLIVENAISATVAALTRSPRAASEWISRAAAGPVS